MRKLLQAESELNDLLSSDEEQDAWEELDGDEGYANLQIWESYHSLIFFFACSSACRFSCAWASRLDDLDSLLRSPSPAHFEPERSQDEIPGLAEDLPGADVASPSSEHHLLSSILSLMGTRLPVLRLT